MSNPLKAQLQNDIVTAIQSLGIQPAERYALADVASIADFLDYKVSERLFAEWQARGIIPSGGELTLEDVMITILALESRECWKSSPSRHDAKKSKSRLVREGLPVDSVRRILSQNAAYDSKLLLCLLRAADDPAERDELIEFLLCRIDPLSCGFTTEVEADA